jgi:hypothetical protein
VALRPQGHHLLAEALAVPIATVAAAAEATAATVHRSTLA